MVSFFFALSNRLFQKSSLTKATFFTVVWLCFHQLSSDPTRTSPTPVDPFDSSYIENLLPSPNKAKYEEQISCNESCLKLTYTGEDQVLDSVWEALGKNNGKIVVEVAVPKIKIDDPKMDTFLEYFREIAKRQGNVHFEPYYIGYKGMGLSDIPMFSDALGISMNLYRRFKSFFLYGRMENYNAKVLYHPKNHDILLIFFFHKNYGNLCDTVYSTCETIQYVDDDYFDLQLSKKLENVRIKNQPVEIRFDQVKAELPQAKLDIDHILTANRSSRVYKWLILSKDTELKKISRERFIDLGLVITILDYTLKAYELIESIQLYMPIRSLKSEVVYEESNDGKIIKSIVISKL